METKHTKGEWRVDNEYSSGSLSHNDNGYIPISSSEKNREWIAEVKGSHVNRGITRIEIEANAKLIAAAPDLLEALIKINGLIADALSVENGKVNIGELAKISITAIKKATE
jgi:hypothetical protein